MSRAAISAGQRLFNRGRFFECHERLEEAWLRAEGREKLVLQGLIQAAAAFHKLGTGSPAGARWLLSRAVEKLEGARLRGLRLAPFVRALRRALPRFLSGADPRRIAPRMDVG